MKKLLIMAVAACCLAACNKELGPEYKVAPVISGVAFSPQKVHAGENVHVSATVTSEYGFTGISILYSLNEDPSTTEEPKDLVWYGSEKDKSKKYEATIKGQKAGTKVTFQVLAVSAYGVYAFSEVGEYIVLEESDPEPMPNPEAN